MSRIAAARAIAACAIAACLAGGCATQRPPEGGPPDSEPPRVVETAPAPGSTRVADPRVRIRFSERVNRQSFEQSLHVSPRVPGGPAFAWSGRAVDVLLGDTLQPNTTYVLAVGTGVKDEHAGNAMAQSYVLAFATGDSLDRGAFRGRVVDAKPDNVSIFAYPLDRIAADTLDPARLEPPFAVQSGSDGGFAFRNVPEGRYRVFAVRDRQGNWRYDPETDAIGVAARDVDARRDDSLSIPLLFRLSVEDTTAPYLLAIEALNARVLRLQWNESLPPEAQRLARLRVADSASGEELPLVSVAADPALRAAWLVFTAAPMRAARYTVAFDSVRDAAGNRAIGSPRDVFTGSAEPDTLAPRVVSVAPQDNAKDAPLDSAVVVRFSRPMRAAHAAALMDSAGRAVEGRWTWTDPHTLRFEHAPLAPATRHRLCLDGPALRDSLRGAALADSERCTTFTTGEARSGSITGSVRDSASPRAARRVTVRHAAGRIAPRQVTAAPDGGFRVDALPQGVYTLEAYEDSDGDGRWSPGRAHPFHPSERFTVLRDSVRVRARWETSGVVLTLP